MKVKVCANVPKQIMKLTNPEQKAILFKTEDKCQNLLNGS